MCIGYGGLDLAVMDVYDARLARPPGAPNLYAAKILDARFPRGPNLPSLGFSCADISYAGLTEEPGPQAMMALLRERYRGL